MVLITQPPCQCFPVLAWSFLLVMFSLITFVILVIFICCYSWLFYIFSFQFNFNFSLSFGSFIICFCAFFCFKSFYFALFLIVLVVLVLQFKLFFFFQLIVKATFLISSRFTSNIHILFQLYLNLEKIFLIVLVVVLALLKNNTNTQLGFKCSVCPRYFRAKDWLSELC